MNRRLMAFAIKESDLMSILMPDVGFKILRSDLPKTAQVLHIYNDVQRSCLVVVFQDESFCETQEGMVIPFGNIELYLKYIEDDNDV